MFIIYHSNGTKTVLRKRPVNTGEENVNLPFKERIRQAYYRLECDLGSRFRSSHTKNTIKKSWCSALILAVSLALSNAADIQSPVTWSDDPLDPNSAVNAARLTLAINGAIVLPAFISGKTTATPDDADVIVFYQASSGLLKKTTLESLFENGTVLSSVALSMPSIFSVSGSPVTTDGGFTVSLATQSANTIFAGPSSGSATTPAFRKLTNPDVSVTTVSISSSDIDWSAAQVFRVKTIAANTTFTFSNVPDGGIIVVPVKQDATGSRTVTWPTASWPGGTTPTQTVTANKTDIWTFVSSNGTIYGNVAQNY